MLNITLDTNVVMEGIDGKKASVGARLKKLAEEGKIDIALTTRVVADKRRDKDETRREKHLKEFEQYPVLGTVARYGLSRYGQDFYGGDTEKLAKQLERILFGKIRPGDKRARNKWADVDHLIGHVRAHRDVFLTWDKGICRKSNQLHEQLGLIVETPEGLLSRFSEQ